MALVRQFQCRSCLRDVTEIVLYDQLCCHCRALKEEADKAAHITMLEGMSWETRVRRLEVLLHALDAEKRLGALEAANARY